MDTAQKPIMNILGVPVTPFTMQEAVSWVMMRTEQKEITQVVTANAEIIMLCQRQPDYKKLLQEVDLVLPDGAGAVWAGRQLGYQVPERVAGYDLFLQLLQYSAQHGTKLFFFGAAPGIGEAAKAKAEVMYPGVKIVGTRNGYFQEEQEKAIVQQINGSGAQVLFTALGAPKQEFWLHKYRDELVPPLRIGLGGSFDVLAGKVQRAPQWMQKASLEWLYRLYKQPSRLGRMMAIPQFMLKVLLARNS